MDNPRAEKMTPLAKRIAAEKNLDIDDINGSGYAGKICADDLKKSPEGRPASGGVNDAIDSRGVNDAIALGDVNASGGLNDAVASGAVNDARGVNAPRDANDIRGVNAARGGYDAGAASVENIDFSKFMMPGFLYEPQTPDIAPGGLPQIEKPPGKLIEFPKSPSFLFDQPAPEPYQPEDPYQPEGTYQHGASQYQPEATYRQPAPGPYRQVDTYQHEASSYQPEAGGGDVYNHAAITAPSFLSAGLQADDLHPQGIDAPLLDTNVETAAREALAAAVKDADEYVAGVMRMNAARRSVAEQTAKSTAKTAAVTQHMETDVTELLALRNNLSDSVELQNKSLMALYIKAIAICVRELSRFRFRLSETEDAYLMVEGGHIGFQVEAGDQEASPVIKDADKKSIKEIVADIMVLSDKAKHGWLTDDDVKGRVITLLDKGDSGVFAFTPIINHPEAAILGIGTVYERLIMTEGGIENRQFIMQSLTFDHRIINGAEADDFQKHLKAILENPKGLV